MLASSHASSSSSLSSPPQGVGRKDAPAHSRDPNSTVGCSDGRRFVIPRASGLGVGCRLWEYMPARWEEFVFELEGRGARDGVCLVREEVELVDMGSWLMEIREVDSN